MSECTNGIILVFLIICSIFIIPAAVGIWVEDGFDALGVSIRYGAGASPTGLCVMLLVMNSSTGLSLPLIGQFRLGMSTGSALLVLPPAWKDCNRCVCRHQGLHDIVCFVSHVGVKHQEIVLRFGVFHRDFPDPCKHWTVVHPTFIPVCNDNVTPLGHRLEGMCWLALHPAWIILISSADLLDWCGPS